MPQLETITGVFDRVRWSSPDAADRAFMIGFLEDGTVILGPAEDGELTPRLTYQFYGKWEDHDEHGRQFKFQQFVQHLPHSREGVVAYLTRHAPGVGPATATRLFDAFGGEAVKVLRTQPLMAAMATNGTLSADKANAAAIVLRDLAGLEDTKIQLVNLFAGRGFPGALVDECIEKWRILAPARIKRDPFCLLVEGLTGCGFARCDRLYMDLGLPPDRLKRQMICLWHVLHSDTSGNTWIEATTALGKLGEMVSGTRLQKKKAAKLGIRSGWLAKHRDEAGVLWFADGERGRDEKFVAEKLIQLAGWTMPDSAAETNSNGVQVSGTEAQVATA
jgi:hypothetical protein